MIDKNIYVEDIVEKYPQLIEPLMEHGIVCLRCGEPVWGTLEELATSKGVDNLDEIIKEMNSLLNERTGNAG